jgi:hypothetical protein
VEDLDRRLAALARSQHSLVTLAQLDVLGFSRTHSSRRAREADAQRQRDLHYRGLTVLEFTGDEVFGRPIRRGRASPMRAAAHRLAGVAPGAAPVTREARCVGAGTPRRHSPRQIDAKPHVTERQRPPECTGGA